ncbi:MAG TPA: glycosyltransferase [Leptolyngbya sp.]|jgi:GT2 family glycosyltransferase|nr:glycosyltransferase [Leptolyngbya sp.]
MASEKNLQLSVCVPTRNRPDSLIRCLNSFKLLGDIAFEVIVLDDASDIPVSGFLYSKIDPDIASKLILLRNEQNCGCSAARNQITRLAKAPYVLGLDDDAELWSAESINAAIEVLDTDPKVGAIAFSQLTAEGDFFPGQPAQHDYNCYVPWYIGYGQLLRRDLFIELDGYREIFEIFYEEAELCARMLDRGYYTVYLPSAGMIHHHSSIGRDAVKCLSNSYRNKCYAAIYNQPLLMAIVMLPLYIFLYFWAHQKIYLKSKKQREKGVKWLISELKTNARSVFSKRKALKWRTYFKLYKIKQKRPKYQGAV